MRNGVGWLERWPFVVRRSASYLLRKRRDGSDLIFTHISEHARLEIPMDLRDPQPVFSPSPRFGKRGSGGEG
jgi:hypothetical protein